MLYWLVELSDEISVLNVFRYITFRTGGAMMTALIFVFIAGSPIIDWLRLAQGRGQPIRSDGPQTPSQEQARHAHHGRADDPVQCHARDRALGQPA